jgi:hypothetical protein
MCSVKWLTKDYFLGLQNQVGNARALMVESENNLSFWIIFAPISRYPEILKSLNPELAINHGQRTGIVGIFLEFFSQSIVFPLLANT